MRTMHVVELSGNSVGAALQVYNLLEDHMKQPKFLKQLEEAKEGVQQPETRPHGNEVFREDWWEAPKGAAGPEAESDEGYLEVHRSFCLVSFDSPCDLPYVGQFPVTP